VNKAIHHVLLIVAVYVLTFLTNIPDYDLWARLAVGSMFFGTGHVPRHDVFSYLPTKDLWIDHEWGTGVVCYAFAKWLGNSGIFVLKGLLIYAIFIMVQKTIAARGSKKTPSILFFAFLGYALFPGIASLVRSHMFTYAFFTVWLYALERVRRNERSIIWVFPATMLIWVNVHGGFLAGIGLLVLYAIGELLNRKSPLPYLWIFLSILPVMLINPYGFALWRFVVEASLLSRPFIPEWHPVSLSGPMQVIGGLRVHFLTGYMLLAGLTAVAALRALLRKQKEDWTAILVLVAMFLLSVRHQRHVVFFVLAAAALMYGPIVGLLDPLRALLDKRSPARSARIQSVLRWGLGYVLPAVLLAGLIPRLSYRMVVDYRRFPVGSLEFIKQNGLSGNLATAFDWGSYAAWKLYPECKVLIDGRYEEVFAPEVFDVAMRLSMRQDRWWEVPSRFPTDIVVLPKLVYRQEDLAWLAGWKPVYQDHVSVVLLPADKIVGPYVRPDYRSPVYASEDLAKPIVAIE
jgi:hypothetical protein